MTRRPALVTQADIARAIRAATDDEARANRLAEILNNDGFIAVVEKCNNGNWAVRATPDRSSTHVYFITDGAFIKIGYSNNWLNRLSSLQTSSPYELKAIAVFFGDQNFEKEMHQKFAVHRLRPGSEWFRDCAEIREYLASRAEDSIHE